MIYAFLFVSCIVFIELFIILDLKRDALELVTSSRAAMEVIMSSDMDDRQKEVFMRRASVAMFKTTFSVVVKFLLIALALYAIYWLVLTICPELEEPILRSLVSPAVVIGLTLAAMAYTWSRNVLLK